VTTPRLLLLLFGAPVVLVVVLGAIVSGGDPRAILFFAQAGLAGVALIAVLSFPLILLQNHRRAGAVDALARRTGGEVVATVAGDRHVRIPQADGTTILVFWTETAEEAGSEDRVAWTCIGLERAGRGSPAIELRLLPTGERVVRWSNRWWDELGRGAPPDPLSTPARQHAEADVGGTGLGRADRPEGRPAEVRATGAADAREAAEVLASLSPGVESRIRWDGDVVAFAIRGTHTDPRLLAILAPAAAQLLARV
jgi:hypothetical protein